MQRADNGNFQSCRLGKQLLHLCTVLSHNADIISARLACPVFFHIQCAKFTKAICREEHLVGKVIGHEHLGPVHHGGCHKSKGVCTQSKGVPFLDHDTAIAVVTAEELLHHAKCLQGGNHHSLGVLFQEQGDASRVIGLHVLNHQVIGGASTQFAFQVFQPLCTKTGIHRIHHGNFFIHDHIGVIRHAVWHHILTLEQVYLMVVDTNIFNILCNIHVSILTLSSRVLCIKVHNNSIIPFFAVNCNSVFAFYLIFSKNFTEKRLKALWAQKASSRVPCPS